MFHRKDAKFAKVDFFLLLSVERTESKMITNKNKLKSDRNPVKPEHCIK